MKRLILTAVCLLALTGTAQSRTFSAGHALLKAQTLGHAADVPASCPAGVPVQTITVVNQANVRPFALAKVERAMIDQSLQLRAAWGTPCVEFGLGGWVFTLAPGATTINPDGSISTAVGGHHYYNGGVVSATIQTGGATYSVWARAFSHEIDEALVDPTLTTSWKFGQLEVCDPVEDWTYTLDGVQISDFALPSYFNGGAGPWDQAGELAGPSSL